MLVVILTIFSRGTILATWYLQLETTKCMILGMQKEGYPIVMPDANMLVAKGDILWVMGSNNHAGALVGEYVR